MLVTRQVPRDRALWFLQAVGQTEISQLSRSKNLQMHPIITYSGDFTVAMVECLKRQIGEALLPLMQNTGTGRLLPGMSVKGRPRNVLAEEQNKDRWLGKWNYTLDLLGACLQENMLDRQRLCTLLLQNLQPQLRIQTLWWLSVILHTAIEDILDTAWMSKTLIVVLHEWLSNLGSPLGEDDYNYHACKEIGQGMLRHLWLTDPEMFLIPSLWTTPSQRSALKTYLGYDDILDEEKEVLNHLEDRVDILLCRKQADMGECGTWQTSGRASDQASGSHSTSKRWHIDASRVVRLLDHWEENQSISLLTEKLFGMAPLSGASCQSKPAGHAHSPLSETSSQERRELVKLLLMWATTTTRCGRHRPYLAVTILSRYIGLSTSEDERRLVRPDTRSDRFEELQMHIMDWIDSQESYLSGLAQNPSVSRWTTRDAILHTCRMLLKQGILEPGGLVQKVIARGYTKAQEAEPNSIYSTILQEYNDRNQTHALRWQMTRVSLSSSWTPSDDASAGARVQYSAQLQPLLERIKGISSEQRCGRRFEDLYPLRDSIMSMSVMVRAATVDDWLLPAIRDALKQNTW